MNVRKPEAFYTIEDIYALPDGERAELIDGRIYAMAPPNTVHQRLVHFFDWKIESYIQDSNGNCEIFPAPFAVFLNRDDATYVEPDISVICDPSKLDDKGCHGAPDWIIEIVSPGNPGHDYIRKLNLYANSGVREYWIVDPRTERVIVYHLEQADFQMDTYTFHDKIKTGIYDNLWIDFQGLNL